ncbi:MAG: phosphoglycerate kinase [Planctomycetes bacterium]|nr:phosphoglycerate kinase [Planctomycetota bacterium]
MARRLSDLDVAGKKVLVRVDFNVPLDDRLHVTSDARIRASLPTIRALLDRGARPILMSHLGRPKGKVVESMRMKPAADRLGELLPGVTVKAVAECVGPVAEAAAAALQAREVLVLENLRFHPEEEKGDPAFAAALAKLADAYVNDAFGTSHRAHASVAGVTEHLPSAAGLLLEAEIDAFAKVLEAPARPLVAVLGGAKVSDKLPVLLHLVEKVDAVLIGGAMAYTFLAQAGVPIGRSLCEAELFDDARRVRELCQQRGVALLLPTDHVCAAEFAESSPASVHGPGVPVDLMGLDIGPETIAAYRARIATAKTIVWNGPMGVFEMAPFRRGTEAIARAVADSSAFSVVGGGDSVAAVEQCGVEDRIDHVSTGGGASLELLEGRALPGITALG